MSTKTIPAQTTKYCDRCDDVMTVHNSRKEGEIVIKAHALDMQGDACADATRHLDVCDHCLATATRAIEACFPEMKKAFP